MSMAGLDEDEDMFAPVITSSRRRAIWLGVNLATAFFAAWVVGLFQATIEQVVALAVLMPIVASMGGIAGSQTLTLMIRGLALGQVQDSNARWLMVREIAVGALNGLAWAAVVAAATVLWFKSWMLGGIIALALVVNLVVAAISGVLIPLLMKRVGIDPALAGSVVLTTVTDAVGFLAFLGLGALLLT
jgi:magnesium transporter